MISPSPFRRWSKLLGALFAFAGLNANADVHFRSFTDSEAVPWQEAEAELPAYPEDTDLIEFVVPVAKARFFVDSRSINPGADGVVRFVLVTRMPGGATNVVFEGIRCETLEYRIYATGRPDRSWSRSRNETWRPIKKTTESSYRSTLSHDFMCPLGNPISSAAEGKDALRRGMHPLVPSGTPWNRY